VLGDLPVLKTVGQILDEGYDEVELSTATDKLNAEQLPWAAPHVGRDTTP